MEYEQVDSAPTIRLASPLSSPLNQHRVLAHSQYQGYVASK